MPTGPHLTDGDAPSDPAVAEIVRLFKKRGGSQYGGEAVTQLEHALQTALLAETHRADSELITSALLHDVGHLLHRLPDDAPDHGEDDHHETLAAQWLGKRFRPAVVEPARLHVAAKRYLCAVDPEYLGRLSAPSATSLKLQGGPMSPAEVEAFRQNPHAEAAVRLRRWDDEAKVSGLATPTLEEFIPHLEAARRSQLAGATS